MRSASFDRELAFTMPTNESKLQVFRNEAPASETWKQANINWSLSLMRRLIKASKAQSFESKKNIRPRPRNWSEQI